MTEHSPEMSGDHLSIARESQPIGVYNLNFPIQHISPKKKQYGLEDVVDDADESSPGLLPSKVYDNQQEHSLLDKQGTPIS